MTAGEIVNVWGSTVALAGCCAFTVFYSLLVRMKWRHSVMGRLLVIKAVAIAAFMAISLCATVLRADPEVLRIVRGILAGLFGTLMFYQSGLVARAQIKGARRHDDA